MLWWIQEWDRIILTKYKGWNVDLADRLVNALYLLHQWTEGTSRKYMLITCACLVAGIFLVAFISNSYEDESIKEISTYLIDGILILGGVALGIFIITTKLNKLQEKVWLNHNIPM